MADSVNIKTFLRIRPSSREVDHMKVDELEDNVLHIKDIEGKEGEEEEEEHGHIPYARSSFLTKHFTYSKIFGMDATQEDVFKEVGKEAVMNVLEGFNSTIFAYGQVCFLF